MDLSPQQVWELLSYHSLFEPIELCRYPWLATKLGEMGNDLTLQHGLYLDTRLPNQPLLYTLNGWIKQKQHEEHLRKEQEIYEQRRTEGYYQQRNLADERQRVERAKLQSHSSGNMARNTLVGVASAGNDTSSNGSYSERLQKLTEAMAATNTYGTKEQVTELLSYMKRDKINQLMIKYNL